MISMMTRTSGLTAIAMLAALFTVAGCSEENDNGEQAATAPAPAESSSATSGAVSAEPAPDAGGADDGADTAETTKTAAADVSTETSTGSATGETAAADAAEPAAQSSAETPDELPEALIGRWGMVPADCTSTRGDAKGLLEISATELEFYESTGRLDTIKEYEPTRVVATFDFTGEGQTWSREMVLDVQDDGETLIRRENGADAASGPFEYSACAAATDGG